jgi:hypothetical protein
MSFWKAITQDVKTSTVNSSTTTLQAKGTVWFTVPNTTNATIGATYTNNGKTFTVLETLAPTGTILKTSGTGSPSISPGTLTYASGTGDATIAYSVETNVSQFTGTAESTLGVAGIQVSLYCTTNCSVYVEQSPNGINWDISDLYNYKYVTHPNFGKTIQAINSYFRVRVQNESYTITSGSFRLQSCLCPIVETLPRSLSEEGLLMVEVAEIEDRYGNKAKISPNGASKTCRVVRLVGASFGGTTIDSSFWSLAASANGSGNQTGGQYELRTITPPSTSSPNGAASLQSQRTARYINGCPNFCRIQADYGGVGVANNTKRWGCFTGTAGSPTNGAMFELINMVPSIATYNGGSAERVNNGSFNGEYGSTLDTIPSGVQTFEIIYNNRYVNFIFNDQIVHKVEAVSAPWSSILSFPCRAENYNTGNSTTDTSLKIRSFVIYRFGESYSRPQWSNRSGTSSGNIILKRGAGTLQKIIINSWSDGCVCSVYDSLTNTNPIGIIAPTSGQQGATVSFSMLYDLDFYTGLTYSTTGTIDVTFIFE